MSNSNTAKSLLDSQASAIAKKRADSAIYRETNRERLRAAARDYAAGRREHKRLYDIEYRRKNHTKRVKNAMDWKKNNPERNRETERAWRARTKAQRLAVAKEWIENNRPRVRAIKKKWAQTHKEHRRAKDSRRRTRERGSAEHYTAADIRALFRMQKGKCAYCRKLLRNEYHVDHIKPIAKGGSDGKRNIQLLCPNCNCLKSATDQIDHVRSRFGWLL